MSNAAAQQKAINDATRDVYHQQHGRLVNDEKAMTRFLNMIQENYFGLEPGYFHGKRILDAGCGDTAKLLIRFHQFGSTDLTGLDLGEAFIPIARRTLERYGVSRKHARLVPGSVDALPFADGAFDLVSCHGVLVHLADFEQVEKAFAELARVTKPGGYLYTVYGLHGGLFEALYPAIRGYYRRDADFKAWVDTISPESFSELFDFMEGQAEAQGAEPLRLHELKELFDVDLCVSIQNIIQAPVRLSISPEFVEAHYVQYGFEAARRLQRYVHRKNIRKFFAPLHFARQHPVARFLYGSGNLEYIAHKPSSLRV